MGVVRRHDMSDDGTCDPEVDTICVRDFTITDEFVYVNQSVACGDLAKELMGVPRGVVFVFNDDGTPVGAVTAREFLVAIMEKKNLLDMTAGDVMNTNIMEVGIEDNITEVVLRISKHTPYAVVVKDTDGVFMGYFSPKDYQEALKKTGAV